MAIVAMVGLVLDGGSAFAQRREEQNVADLAAMAGATAHLNTKGDAATKQAAAIAAANEIALDNRYVADPTNGFTIDVNVTNSAFYGQVQVQITRPHRNNFAAVLGMTTWLGLGHRDGPFQRVSRMPRSARCRCCSTRTPFRARSATRTPAVRAQVYQLPGTGNEDVPQDATQFNWTIFCTASGNPCNANRGGVRDTRGGRRVERRSTSTTTSGRSTRVVTRRLFSALEAHIGGVSSRCRS